MHDGFPLPRTALALAFLALLLGACVRATFIPTGTVYPPKAPDCEIQVFSSGPPQRPYEELGVIEAEGSEWRASLEDILPRLREEACLAGGDALILQSAQRFEAGRDEDDEPRMFAMATVIRWTEGG